jgi:hypothetical protein
MLQNYVPKYYKISLAQKRLSEMDSLKCKFELKYIKLSDKNFGLDLEKSNLEEILTKKRMN